MSTFLSLTMFSLLFNKYKTKPFVGHRHEHRSERQQGQIRHREREREKVHKQARKHKLQTKTQEQKWRIQKSRSGLALCQTYPRGRFCFCGLMQLGCTFVPNLEVIFDALTDAQNPSKGHLESFEGFF